MPFKLGWPFHWPKRDRKPEEATDSRAGLAPAAPTPVEPARPPQPAAPEAPAGPVQLARAEAPGAPVEEAAPLEGGDLGQELLQRLPSLATPPMLGRLGGLPLMAQTLPAVERFIQQLPAPPPEPLLAGLSEAGEFAATLPSLAGFVQPGRAEQPPAFPAELEPPSEPTDVLAPPGGMPGQIAGLSGATPVLTPETRARVVPQIVAVTPPAAPAPPTAPSAAVQKAAEPPAPQPGAKPAPITPAAPSVALPGLARPPVVAPQRAPMTQVLPVEQTLTGNILPAPAGAAVQREMIRRAEEEWAGPAEFVEPPERPGERVTPAQREMIESQRGQGRPLEPETRQHFEQAYAQPLDQVRVHTDPTAHEAAQSLNAIAFASGNDLFFTQNTYAPESPQGLSLLGHELAHVIQQQYGVSGEADELRPPEDRYEQQADQLAARALETPLAEPAERPAPAQQVYRATEVQRATDEDELRQPGTIPLTGPTPLKTPPLLAGATAYAPGAQLASAEMAGPQPLASAPVSAGKRPEDEEPVLRAVVGRPIPASSPIVAVASAPLPSLERTPERAVGLTEQLLSPAAMLAGTPSLSRHLPGLGPVSEAGQGLPVFRSLGLPSLGNLPQIPQSLPDLGQASLPDLSALTNQLPSAPSLPSLGGNAPAMPNLGAMAQGLSSNLPQMPNLPAMGGLTPPAMPLAQGLAGAVQGAAQSAEQAGAEAAGGALAAGQQALGSITGMGPGPEAGGGAPPLPSLDKLTEHIWKEVQRKLKVERERSRGLA